MTSTPSRRGARALRLASAMALLASASVAVAASPASAADDTTPPELVAAPWDTPAVSLSVDDHWFSAPTATIHLHAADPSGVTLNYRVVHSFATIDSGSQTSDSGVSAFPQIVAEGESWIIYSAVDSLGNSTEQRAVHVVIDTTAPEIAVASPAELLDGSASYAFGAQVPLTASCSDAYGSLCTLSDSSELPAFLATDVAGEHELQIHARDLVGHDTVVTLHYTVEAAPAPEAPAPQQPAAAPLDASVSDPDAPTLAYTGIEDSWPFALAAVLLVVVGGLLVRRASRVQRPDAAQMAETVEGIRP